MTRESLEHGELARGERHLRAVAAQGARAEVELEVAEGDGGVLARGCTGRVGGRAAAQHRVNARQQLARIEGLGQIVVGPHLQPHDAVHVLALGGEQDDRGLVLLAPQAAQDGQAILARHHKVEDQEVVALAHPQTVQGGAAIGHEHRKAVLAEVAAQQVAQAGVVVDNQDLGWAVHGRAREGCGSNPRADA